MPAALTTSGQRFSSLLMKASNCCAVPPTMSAACASGDGGAHRRHLQNLVEDAVDARDQRRIHAGRPGDAVPNGDVEAGYRLADRRRVRQLRHRPHRDAGKSANPAFPDLAERGRERDDRGVGFVFQERRQHFRARAIDDVDLVDPGLAVEIGHEQMRPVAQARRGVVELARLLFCRGDEFGQRRIGQCRPDQDDRRQVGGVDDRREGGVRVVGQLGRACATRRWARPRRGTACSRPASRAPRRPRRWCRRRRAGSRRSAAARWRIAQSRSTGCATACRPRRPRRPSPAAEPGGRAIAPPAGQRPGRRRTRQVARAANAVAWRRARLAKCMTIPPVTKAVRSISSLELDVRVLHDLRPLVDLGAQDRPSHSAGVIDMVSVACFSQSPSRRVWRPAPASRR